MTSSRIICILLATLGIISISQAKFTLKMVSVEPTGRYIYEGNVTKMTCEASDDSGHGSPTITWHEGKTSHPAYKNSSTITILSRTEGNTTVSSIRISITMDIEPYFSPVFYFYCVTNKGAEEQYKSKVYTYVKKSAIPRLQVQAPLTEKVSEGTRRHVLTCNVLSNVDIAPVYIKWMYGGKTINEKKADMKTNTSVEHSVLLQCLTKKDLGGYKCTVTGTKYGQLWHQSAVTVLTANFLKLAESAIPRLQVQAPLTEKVSEGTRRHVLTCNVLSNVDIAPVYIKWMYGGKTINEKKADMKTNTSVEHSVLLQCLTKKDLGGYKCTVTGTKYGQLWHQSAVTVLTANFLKLAENAGVSMESSVVLTVTILTAFFISKTLL